MSEFDYTQEERFGRDITSKLYSSFFAVDDVTFIVGEEDTNVVEVNLQLVDLAGNPVPKSMVVTVHLSSDPDSIVVDATKGSMAIATGGAGTLVNETVAGGVASFQTDAEGKLDIALSDDSDLNVYMIVALPSGDLATSSEIVFTAA